MSELEKASLSLTGIHHIGIVVADLDAGVKLWRDRLSVSFKGIKDVPGQKVRIAMFEIGSTHLELITPTSPDSTIAKFLRERGEGLHHIALRTENCKETLAELQERGISLIDREPRVGAGGTRIGFLHPKSLRGVLVELVESKQHHQ
jgi:methylmalonyl-CoA/ethylmalonyl-CoA epimerase